MCDSSRVLYILYILTFPTPTPYPYLLKTSIAMTQPSTLSAALCYHTLNLLAHCNYLLCTYVNSLPLLMYISISKLLLLIPAFQLLGELPPT